jgi:hypothetical protein
MVYRAIVPALLAAGVLMGAAQDAPKSIKDVMAAHKGKDSMVNKIIEGKGSEEDVKKLVGLYEFLATQKAPMGDEASWKEKTGALVSAAKEVADKKPTDNLKKASNCKACHDVHRPKK